MTLTDAGTAAYLERRRGIVRIPSVDLLALLEVTPDTGIVGMSTDWPTDTVRLLITSPTLDPVDDGAEPPVVDLADLGGRLRLPSAPQPQHPELAERLEAAELVVSGIIDELAPVGIVARDHRAEQVRRTLIDVRHVLADARTALIPQETP